MLGRHLVLFEVPVEVAAIAQLLHRAKAVVVDFEQVQQLHHPRILQLLVDLVLSDLRTRHVSTPFRDGEHGGMARTGLQMFWLERRSHDLAADLTVVSLGF